MISEIKVSESNDATSTSLLLGVQAGEHAPWSRLVALYGGLIYRWCRQRGLDQAAAADVVQEVFLAVHRKATDFRRDRPGDTFRGWMRRITINKIHDLHRRRARQPLAVGGSTIHRQLQQLPDEAAVENEQLEPECRGSDNDGDWLYQRAVELVRDQFESTTWQAFWMVAVEGRPPQDVMEALAISRNAVYIAKSRVLSRLRAEFAEVID